MEKTRKMDNLSNMNKKRIKLGKSVKMLCMLIAVFIVSFIGIDSVLITNAASAGVYTTTTIPSYKHPVTGEVEDSGNNEGIGQPMTESVVNNTSLIEVDADANTYVTVRYFLMDNLSDIKFWVQEDSNSSFSSVSYEVMQENVGGEYCSDFRLDRKSVV